MAALYQQLEEELRNKIISDEWKAEMRVPSELELCEEYDLSRSTVRKALDSLVSSGYLQRIQGKGTFVRSNMIEQKLSKFYSFSEEFRKRGMKELAVLHDFRIVEADEEVAGNLNINEGERVYEITRTRLVNDMVYALETSYIPVSFSEDITAEMISNNGLYRTMGLFHFCPDRAVEQLTAVAAGERIASYLKVDPDTPCMRIERIAYNSDRPVEFCESYTKGDMFSYTVELR